MKCDHDVFFTAYTHSKLISLLHVPHEVHAVSSFMPSQWTNKKSCLDTM